MHQLQQRTAAAFAVRPPARFMLSPRSTSVSPGGIAGAVIGSVVGALLIAFCVFPFVIRARRRRLARHDDPGLAEMGQRPGGPNLDSQKIDDDSYKRSSASGPESTPVHHVPPSAVPDQKAQSTLPQSVAVENGLPSPVSSPTSPTDPSSRPDEAAVSPTLAAAPSQSPVESLSKSHDASPTRGNVSRESTREASLSDAYGPPTRELTGITAVGITEEPESIDQPSSSPDHGHFPHLRESLRGLIHGRRSSHHRRDSRRSTHAGTAGTRSPSATTNDYLVQQPGPSQIPSGFEIDVEAPGLAWDYYHDPSLGVDLSGPYPQSTPTATSAGIAPSAHPASFAPAGTGSLAGQVSVTGAEVAPSMGAGPIAEGVNALPNNDATATPGVLITQSTFLQNKGFVEPLQRTDSFPIPTIVSDLPSPPFAQYTSTVPSGNPMEMMKPTNLTENAFMLEHEMRMIQNSPPAPAPAPASEPAPFESMPADGFAGQAFDNDEKPQFQSQFESQYQSPYQSPPQTVSEHAAQMGEGYYNANTLTTSEYNANALSTSEYNPNMLTTSDYSTPPPSTGPSAENTPDTRLTPYTASPSPPAEVGASVNNNNNNNNHLMPSPGLSAGLSPTPGLSPAPSPGRSPVPSPGRSPGRSPARPPGGFVCDVCGAVKNSYHQFNHHRRYHDRPWACDQPGCGRRFGTVTHLRRHVNDKHHKTRKFYCTEPGCDYSRQGTKSFPRKDNWKRHMLKKHSVDPQNVTDEDYLGDDVAMDGS
ncbi:hypothetical protein P885DRAFT_59129 [Corynascus similis CBS 632.67]